MSCLILKVDVPAGITIQDACKDAIILASKIDTKIQFEFNDKTIYAIPYNNVNSLIKAYHYAVKTNSDFVCCLDKIY